MEHPLALNIKRRRKLVTKDEPPEKREKLAIAAETENDRYDTMTRVDCFKCNIEGVDENIGKLPDVIEGILKANTYARQEEIKEWELEIQSCDHVKSLHQQPGAPKLSEIVEQCGSCDLQENLWLCLTCGNLACGREQYGGIPGKGHAKGHYKNSTDFHPAAVKLGSLSADGEPDVFCYACPKEGEERHDPSIDKHLKHFGIEKANRQKTERTLVEMQIDQNYQFSMTSQDGMEMKPLFGKGLTGIKNLGNSCYLASVVQCLFDMPEFSSRYYRPNESGPDVQQPADDLETQLRKLAEGLLSGRYSHPDQDMVGKANGAEVPHQRGLTPAMFKHLIGRGHPEFSSSRQQDASELLMHLLRVVSESPHPHFPSNPVDAFKFLMEQRLQCTGCEKVRYSTVLAENITMAVPQRPKDIENDADNEEKQQFEPVTFKECLDTLISPTTVEKNCSSCKRQQEFTQQQLFKTFPDILTINCARFEVKQTLTDYGMMTEQRKIEVPILVGDEPVNFSEYYSHGLRDNETELPEDPEDVAPASKKFVPDGDALSHLLDMGFGQVACEKALQATGNAGVEEACNWLASHLDDPDLNIPVDEDVAKPKSSDAIPQEAVDTVVGVVECTQSRARQALRMTGGDPSNAVNWLFSNADAEGVPEDDGDIQQTLPDRQHPDKLVDGHVNGSSNETTNGHHDQYVSDSHDRVPNGATNGATNGLVNGTANGLTNGTANGLTNGTANGHVKAQPEKKDYGTGEPDTEFQLQSIVCHKGAGVHAGHYVAFIRKILNDKGETNWVLYNDEKVAPASDIEETRKFAYIYFFRRVGA